MLPLAGCQTGTFYTKQVRLLGCRKSQAPLTSKEIDLHLQCSLSQVEVLILNYYYIWSAFESGHIARFPGGVHVTVHPHEEQGTFGHPSGKKMTSGAMFKKQFS